MKSSSSWPIGLLVVVYLSLVITQVYSDISHLKAPEHDPIAATRGLIKRRLGQEYNHQVRNSISTSITILY
jgi:hypothetical protein